MRHLLRACRSVMGTAGWLLICGYFLLVGTIIVLRVAVLPHVEQHREQLTRQIEAIIGEPVQIGALRATWQGLNPYLVLTDFRLLDAQGHTALSLPQMEATVSWLTLLSGELRLAKLRLTSPALELRRDRGGRLHLAGVTLGAMRGTGGAFETWLLRQSDVAIDSGSVRWLDELRGAPELDLVNVHFRLLNRLGARHELSLMANPPAALASGIELRARFAGDSLSDLDHWNGNLYAHCEDIDLAGWTAWVDYPVPVSSGRGALTLSTTFADSRLGAATAEVSLTGLHMQLSAASLPFELSLLRGRLSARQSGARSKGLGFLRSGSHGSGYTLNASDLTVQATGGAVLAHVNIDIALSHGAQDTPNFAKRPEPSDAPKRAASGRADDWHGHAHVNQLDVAALLPLAGALPLPDPIRSALSDSQLRGVFSDLTLDWSGGPIDAPAHYRMNSRFSGLATRGRDRIPGVDEVAGRIEWSDQRGRLIVEGRNVALEAPALLPRAGRLVWDRVALDLDWEGTDPWRMHLARAILTNRDVALNARGSWRWRDGLASGFDLNIELARAELASVYRYLPPGDDEFSLWMQSALQAGVLLDAHAHLVGDPAELLTGNPHSRLDITGRIERGRLRFQPNWPSIEDIAGRLSVHDRAFVFSAQRALTVGAPLRDVQVRMAELYRGDRVVLINGNAEADAAGFLSYVADSPLRDSIGSALKDMVMEGRGRLELQVSVPLARPNDTKAKGVLQATLARWQLAAGQPAATQVSGRGDFTDRDVAIRGKGLWLGGASSFSLDARDAEPVSIAIDGSASTSAIAAGWPVAAFDRVQGAATYHARVRLSPRETEFTLDSDLRGIAINLPPPLGKPADQALALHIHRQYGTAPSVSDRLDATLGAVAGLVARLQAGTGGRREDHVGLSIGDVRPTVPNTPGVTVDAQFDALDMDRWMAQWPELANSSDASVTGGASTGRAVPLPATASAAPALFADGTGSGLSLQAVRLRATDMTAFGRALHRVSLQAKPLAEGWAIELACAEATGSITWNPGAGGHLVGHFSDMAIAEAAIPHGDAVSTVSPVQSVAHPRSDLPSMDISAERLVVSGRDLGRLELSAENSAVGWRVNTFSLTAPEGRIHGKGVWRNHAAPPEVDLEFGAEADDAGKYIARLGSPGALSGAASELSGHVHWLGVPHEIDYASLTGDIVLRSGKGQFLRVEPGAGRLLGVLSLQSLPRRVTLDFRDVFNEGFAFDEIEAKGRIDHGLLQLGEFRMTGPAAAVQLNGALDLASETQHLHARIVPEIGDGVAAAAGFALLNPLLGVGTLIAQRILRDPLGKLFAYDYEITGPWRDPHVVRQTRPVVRNESAEPVGSPTPTGSPTPIGSPPSIGSPSSTGSPAP